MPPLQQRLPQRPPNQAHGGGDSWRPSVPQNDFAFRNDPSAPRYPPEGDHYRPTNDRPYCNNNRYGYGASNRGRGPRWATAARPLLSSKRGNSPEDVLAQADAQNKAQRFLPADDVSDSDEEEMQESDLDEQKFSSGGQDMTMTSLLIDQEQANLPMSTGIAENLEPPTKRRATATTFKDAKEAASVPKWSNPDPYTVLPPVDESQRKRKDVVKIIRKARIAAEKGTATANQVAANDDFISFGHEGDPDSDRRAHSSSPPEPPARHEFGVPGAPTGPRAFSHLNNLHVAYNNNHAPGTIENRPSITDLGPPPGLTNGPQAKPDQKPVRQDFYPDQAEALGNRKRTFDDDIKRDAIPKAGGKKAPSNGTVLKEWIPRGNTNPTPWLADDHRSTKNPGFRLHKEICDFYQFVRPQSYEQILREDLLQRLQLTVKERLPDCDLYCFGSFAAGMYLPNADMDLVVISSTFRKSGQRTACQSSGTMHKFAYQLEKTGLATSGSAQVIFHAKVPIIKFIDQMTGIHVDVSFENETGLVANETFSAWKHQYPAMPILTTLVKQFLKMRGLGEVVNGGLGGFSVTCLVTSLLQNLPRVQSGEMVPEQNLGEILIEFLDLYGNQFDLARTGISMDPPCFYDKQAAYRSDYRQEVYQGNRGDRLAITDPNNPKNDISGGSKNVSRIFKLFSEAHEEIFKAMRSPNRISLLDWTLGGDYHSFAVQRQRLRDLYEARWGGADSARTPMGPLSPNPSMLNSGTNTNQKENTPLSAIAGFMFSNPMDPGVVPEPKEKALKRLKAKRKRKAQKNDENVIVLNTVEKSSMKTRAMRKSEKRARKLKARSPSMAIPDWISKQGRRAILPTVKAANITPIETNARYLERKKERAAKKADQNPKRTKKAKKKGKAQYTIHAPDVHGVSAARLAETAKNVGNAHDFPLIID
ncbi:MAG: hypothetical protein Q9188_003951 [Gyalolechia gomerana]